MKKYILYIGGILLLLSMFSCSEEWMSDVVPTDKIEKGEALKTLKDARNAVNGVFSYMQGEDYYGSAYIAYGDLKGVDVRSTKSGKRNFSMYRFNESTEASKTGMWEVPYTCLASINNAIPQIDGLPADTEDEKLQKAEIQANFYALRALCHFDLLKIYARIPASVANPENELGIVIVDKVLDKRAEPARSTLKASYDFVIADLKKALEIIPETPKAPKEEDWKNTIGWISKTAVKALLANVYLFNGQNQLAYDMAKEVIDNPNYKLMTYENYSKSWGATDVNTETILAIINTEEDNGGREGIGYLWSKTGYATMSLTNSFMTLLKEEPNDVRFKLTREIREKVKDEKTGKEEEKVTSVICAKYPSDLTNKLRILRLSEMYFIAAEAAQKLGNISEAKDLLNTIIEKRTKVANKLTEADITIERVILEKRKEFFGEGKAFFDFMRNKMNIVRAIEDLVSPAPAEVKYDDYRTIQPIPRIELNSNKNIQQNPEYAK